ncbi:MAG: PrsW family intramembrane metalloprotease [Candidatus Thermoplasmatota archaeon]|nr:PrsW family intramembrane metalloprotease [Candidatus Thermoplasmatota archaeon]
MIDIVAQTGLLAVPVVLVLILFAFLPPVIFVIWFRNAERYEREPWSQVFRAFGWGAFIGVIVAIILSLILAAVLLGAGTFVLQHIHVGLAEALDAQLNLSVLILLVVVAPIAEEFAKGLGVFRVRQHINEVEDGVVYGAAAGLGFAATENVIFGAVAFAAAGLGASLILIGIRSFSSALLHAAATGTFGYGVAVSKLVSGKTLLPFYLLAVLMHGIYNFFAGLGELFVQDIGVAAASIGLIVAVVLALIAISLTRSTIARYDRPTQPPA